MASAGAGVVCSHCPLAKSEVIWFSCDAIKVPTHLLRQFKCPYGINPQSGIEPMIAIFDIYWQEIYACAGLKQSTVYYLLDINGQ
jgi:hypothetical protein